MAELTQLKKERTVLRGVFTRGANDFEEAFADSNTEELQTKFEMLELKFERLRVVQEKIFDNMTASESVKEEELGHEWDSSDLYVSRFITLKNKFINIKDREVVAERESVSSAGGSRRRFKLPQLEFKKFSGDIKEWLPFWNQFRKIDEDADIEPSDKIDFLYQATPPNSDARRIVESFPAVDDNYVKIVNLLKSRYGREDLQIEVYVRELLKLVIVNSGKNGRTNIAILYDTIETQLRNLETLGITTDKCTALLFPLVESCLPEELLRIWQRSHCGDLGSLTDSVKTEGVSNKPKNRLESLLNFLKNEVDNEQRIALASEGLISNPTSQKTNVHQAKRSTGDSGVSTAAGLVNCEASRCVFCGGLHLTQKCFKAQKLPLDKRKDLLMKSRACFICLKIGHPAKSCRDKSICVVCKKRHNVIICPQLGETQDPVKKEPAPPEEAATLANSTSACVFLQTLKVVVSGPRGKLTARALLDSASQHSYIVESVAEDLGLPTKGVENLTHALFGGVNTAVKAHRKYPVTIGSTITTLNRKFVLLSEMKICSTIPPISHGPCLKELEEMSIDITDRDSGPIQILFGADYLGELYTGKRQRLRCGLIAYETIFGWTLMGKTVVQGQDIESLTALSVSLLASDSISRLWDLDCLGIKDPLEKKSQEEVTSEAQEFFVRTVTRNQEGRYEVRLPWHSGHPPLPDNLDVARKRLDSCVQRLNYDGLMDVYDAVFQSWLEEDIIEEVGKDAQSNNIVHYLPHRPVIKESATTPVRPVFDASAHPKGKPSLNDCLEKGANLIEKIPGLLLRFRTRKVGVVSDIRKAFLQISVNELDRDCLRFLWLSSEGTVKVLRHKRVVFGVSSSPFLLGSTVNLHLENSLKTSEESNCGYSTETVLRLQKSFYVDNCLTSLDSKNEATIFMNESVAVMAEGGFDLRGWEFSDPDLGERSVSVLGMIWDCRKDCIFLNENSFTEKSEDHSDVTKRHILSVLSRIFDPIGYTSPATLLLKIMLQKSWERKLPWDTPVDEDLQSKFKIWKKQMPALFSIKIPRWIHGNLENRQLHVFCDASGDAYAAAIFLRVEEEDKVHVSLLCAKSRVAPLKNSKRKLSIPRLELLAASVGSRLYNDIKNEFSSYDSFFWSDSSTVISWIRRSEEWSPFVGNRVREIRSLTPFDSWRHVPGSSNPADLPSRGCTPGQLGTSKWWEGPEWLLKPSSEWPIGELQVDDEEVNEERKKRIVVLASYDAVDWHLSYFSRFPKTLRMIAWIFRFLHNVKTPSEKRKGSLTVEELATAENFIFKNIQAEVFSSDDQKLRTLHPFVDSEGIIRIKTRLTERKDTENFKCPIVLPGKHTLVRRLIMSEHENSSHTGTQCLLARMRERFWIVGGRRAVRSVVSSCVICKRFTAKHFQVDPPPLPANRVRDARVFEVTGVDFAGPLFLKSKQKAWICLFTCGVYRAVHLELTTSMSTSGFVQVLRRFISRRGRPSVMYSDNGSNFVGAENLFHRINWENIQDFSTSQRIQWRFNPPTAAWWGGFWERLIGMMKQILRRVLGRASLDYEDLSTIICDCEAIINSRPISYMSENPSDLEPLTPAMFLQDVDDVGVPDLDAADQLGLSRRVTYRNTIRNNLRQRFRSEYLGQLRTWQHGKPTRPVTLGEVVLVGSDDSKRLDWPLGRVVELIRGADNETRLARVRTSRGCLLRPVQRLYPLEIICHPSLHQTTTPEDTDDLLEESCGSAKAFSDDSVSVECCKNPNDLVSNVKVSRVGRVLQKPKRLMTDFCL